MMHRRSPSDGVVGAWAVAVVVPLLATLPMPRYLLLAFPALAIVAAHALARLPAGAFRPALLMLALSVATAAVYLGPTRP